MIIFHKPLIVPKGFFKKRKVDGVNADGCEILVSRIVNNMKGGQEIIRGNALKKEPDYLINGEWVEVTYAERKAQKTMVEEGIFTEERDLNDILKSLAKAVDIKANKTYSVDEYGCDFEFGLLPFNV